MDVEELWAGAPTPPWRDDHGELLPVEIPALVSAHAAEAVDGAPSGVDHRSSDAWPGWPVS